MIADIPQSPDTIYQDYSSSKSFYWTSKRNNYSSKNQTNEDLSSSIRRVKLQRKRHGYDEVNSKTNEEFGLDVFLKIKVSIIFL